MRTPKRQPLPPPSSRHRPLRRCRPSETPRRQAPTYANTLRMITPGFVRIWSATIADANYRRCLTDSRTPSQWTRQQFAPACSKSTAAAFLAGRDGKQATSLWMPLSPSPASPQRKQFRLSPFDRHSRQWPTQPSRVRSCQRNPNPLAWSGLPNECHRSRPQSRVPVWSNRSPPICASVRSPSKRDRPRQSLRPQNCRKKIKQRLIRTCLEHRS